MDIWTDITIREAGSEHSYKGQISEPTNCPQCKREIKPQKLAEKSYKNEEGKYLFAVLYLCTGCYNSFLAQYEIKPHTKTAPNKVSVSYLYDSSVVFVEPKRFVKRTFEEKVNEISPSFVRIYNQALAGETSSLDEIAGLGYRKALEFLLKDFLKQMHPEKIQDIEEKPLGVCIKTYVEDTNLKTVASRAAWLGNDQAHYVRKFDDKDISDLKRMIEVTLHWVQMILLTQEAEGIEAR